MTTPSAAPRRRLTTRRVPAFLLAALALAGGAAIAQTASVNRVIEAPVSALQTEVSRVQAGNVTYIGYRVSVRNAGGNTVNNVLFTATTQGPTPDTGPAFDSSEGRACTASSSGRVVSCPVGQLKAGEETLPFLLFFAVPSTPAAPAPSPQCSSGECLSLTATVFYAEGTGGLYTSVPQNSAQTFPPVVVALGTGSADKARSAVPRGGASLATGDGIPKPTDPLTTRVVVPSSTTFTTTAEIDEMAAVGCTNLITCQAADIRIPGTFAPFLRITLRQDAENLRPGAKLGTLLVEYTPTLADGSPAGPPLLVGQCEAPGVPRADGHPCIESSRVFRKNTTDITALEGDVEWVIISLRNGSYKIL